MSAPGKLVRSSRWKSGPSKGQRPLGSECCVVAGDSDCEAYTAIARGVGLSHERSDIAGAEGFHSLEGNMCGTAMRGADALPGSKATSRATGSYRNLGGLVSDRNGAAVAGPHREGEEPKPMMHGHEKSDPAIVAVKPANKAKHSGARPIAAEPNAAEPVERRAGTKGNADRQSTDWTQSQAPVSQALERIRKVARERKKERFTALFHHISIDLLEQAFYELKTNAAPGVDQLTWTDYEADLDDNIEDLHNRVQQGAYRVLPSRRVYIPKPDGGQRPLAVSALEDKIVQRTVAVLLNAIYEEDFLGFAYGFRPGRGTHDALDALCVGISSRKVSWIADADIRSFFDAISQEWLIRFLEHRIGDRRIIRLIRKWLKAGVLEDGVVTTSEQGTGQGSVISPLLANVYLHYVLDLWANRWRRREATGDMIIVRYADDFIVGFQHESDARRFLDEMRERLGKFALSLNPEKTRCIEFGRFAAERRERRGLGKPETFDFLGFTFICGKTRTGKFQIKRKTRRDRMRAKLKMMKEELWQRMHQPLPLQGNWLRKVVTGYFNYHAVPTNGRTLSEFLHHVAVLWQQTLRRRSQRIGSRGQG